MALARYGAMRMNELVDLHDLPRRNLARVVTSLERAGLVRRDQHTLEYDLGATLAWLGKVAGARSNIATLAKPLLDELMEKTHTTALLHLRQVDSLVAVQICVPQDRLSVTLPIGARIPFDRGTGRAVLAFLPEDEQRQFTERPGASVEPGQLADIRRRGYELSYGEVVEGVRAVGAPVFDPGGEPVAVVALAGISDGVMNYAPVVAETARRITAVLASSMTEADNQDLPSSGTSDAGGRQAARVGPESSPAAIRAWARAEGVPVPDRGRIPARVRDLYDAANMGSQHA